MAYGAYNLDEITQWFFTDKKPIAVALVIHGINTKPSKMNPVVGVLNQQGIHVLRITLNGHGGDLSEFQNVTREKWLENISINYSSGLPK